MDSQLTPTAEGWEPTQPPAIDDRQTAERAINARGDTMSTKNQRQAAQIEEHGRNLAALVGFGPGQPDTSFIALATRVHRLEAKAQRLALHLCNDPTTHEEQMGATHQFSLILNAADRVLNFRVKRIPVHVNIDPRGYALKIDSDWMREPPSVRLHRDMGGYGILAPEFEGEE